MKTGIIVYSQTGNTLQVAEKLALALRAEGCEAQVERVTATQTNQGPMKGVTLATAPDTAGYNLLLMGAPVQAFSLSAVMKAYLAQLPDLRGKRVTCFVTQHFPKPWMGGNRSVRQIREAVAQKGGQVDGCYVINWSSKERDAQIDAFIAQTVKAVQQAGNQQ